MTMTKKTPLTHGKFALVDDDDYERVTAFKWRVIFSRNRTVLYAGRRPRCGGGKKTTIYLHRFILRVKKRTVEVDHINGNRLDNRKANLRRATRRQNAWNVGKTSKNTTGFKGVRYQNGGYDARISTRQGQKHIGRFKTAAEAARAVDAAALKHHGKFACLNFGASL